MRTNRLLIPLLASSTLYLAACSPDNPPFSEARARAHVEMLAGTIGSRPVGTPANAHARQYLIGELAHQGFDVRVQEIDAVRPELGMTARVANIIAVRPGARREAIALVAHYDSRHDTPGAADDALGTAVCLEAARILGSELSLDHSLFVLLTDGEEVGLMGAAGVITDTEVMERLRFVINLEAAGSAGPVRLFEVNGASRFAIDVWARHVPSPSGSSLNAEVYRRLPNDTDFSIFRSAGVAGMNFAVVGDAFAYHTARDTPDRLSARTLREMGRTTVALVAALDDRLPRATWDPERTGTLTAVSSPSPPATLSRWPNVIASLLSGEPVFFDLARSTGVVFGSAMNAVLLVLALIAGTVSWVRVFSAMRSAYGLARLFATIGVYAVGTTAVAAAAIGSVWALRTMAQAYHPWHAHPERFFLFLAISSVTVGWLVSRLAVPLPERLRSAPHPAGIWLVALPVWIFVAALSAWAVPTASYLWSLPLLTAGILLAATPVAHPLAVRISSVVVLAVVGVLWLPDMSAELPLFIVALLGRVPIVTPVWVYPALLLAIGIVLAPPVIAVMTAPDRSLLRDVHLAAVLGVALAASAVLSYVAPAYTFERPERRTIRYVDDRLAGHVFWEIGGNEPELNLRPGGPEDWQPVAEGTPESVPLSPLPSWPFRHRAKAGPEEAPAVVTSQLRENGDGFELEVAVVPTEPGTWVSLSLPPGVEPLSSNFPGIPWRGRWRATYVAPRMDGIAFRLLFTPDYAPRDLRGSAVSVLTAALPRGQGWQRLPPWLPQDRTVWDGRAMFVLPVVGGSDREISPNDGR
jgi:hypothetical protein